MTPEDAASFERTLELGKEIADSLSETAFEISSAGSL
jgi:hypothetical protein